MDGFVSQHSAKLLEEAKHLSTIPSPSFEEQEKVMFVTRKLSSIGLKDAGIDGVGNAVAILPGAGNGSRAILVSAHADTVFPRGTELRIREDAEFIYCPGIVDNSTGIAAMLQAAEFFTSNPTKNRLIFAANVCEEGLGDLKGIRHLIDAIKPDVHICIEGHNIGRFTYITVGSYRLKITVETAGGHSWRDFGRPNAIKILSDIIGEISKFPLPSDPNLKTTFNFGTISGGTSINAIASRAEMLVDIRSISAEWLEKLKTNVLRIVETCNSNAVKAASEVVGERPGGALPESHWLVKTVRDIHSRLGIASDVEPGSTDSNYPISKGIPSITIGITKGFNTHSEKEYMSKKYLALGLKQLVEVIAAVDEEL